MASDELKEMRKNLTKEAIREHQMAKTGGTQTDLFTCGKCKKKNCTYTQVWAYLKSLIFILRILAICLKTRSDNYQYTLIYFKRKCDLKNKNAFLILTDSN